MKKIFDLCDPRDDVVKGEIAGSDFAADRAHVIKGTAPNKLSHTETLFPQHLSDSRTQEPLRAITEKVLNYAIESS